LLEEKNLGLSGDWERRENVSAELINFKSLLCVINAKGRVISFWAIASSGLTFLKKGESVRQKRVSTVICVKRGEKVSAAHKNVLVGAQSRYQADGLYP
jgi:hypothetical protein